MRLESQNWNSYCRRVAGAVGKLSIRAFGDTSPAAEELALVLGEALQTTNILRDIDRGHREGVTPRSLRAYAQTLEGTVALLRRIAEGESTFRRPLEIPSGLDRETEQALRAGLKGGPI